tara:strand:- start:160 stop:720 length:561 start_codon:yes stop_codon:yes gene_type:complete
MKKYLIVGLGNIGSNYENTRHNIGFNILDSFAENNSAEFSSQKYGKLCNVKIKENKAFLLKPDTFMNLSGKAIYYYINYYKIPIENILVISDDLHLEFGIIKFKKKGSHGGHNGHKSIMSSINTSIYCRLKFGISKNFNSGQQIKYVLSKWTENEKNELEELLKKCCKIIYSYMEIGPDKTMNNFN